MNAARKLDARQREPDGMHFLKTLFWVLVAVVVALFAVRNWTPVTLNLGGTSRRTSKFPILLLIFFLLGFLPTWATMRTRLWSHRRRVEALERSRASAANSHSVADEEERAQ